MEQSRQFPFYDLLLGNYAIGSNGFFMSKVYPVGHHDDRKSIHFLAITDTLAKSSTPCLTVQNNFKVDMASHNEHDEQVKYGVQD